MVQAQIWRNISGLWFGRLIDPVTGMPDWQLFEGDSRSGIIARIRLGMPLTHLLIEDCIDPTDP